MARHPRRFNRRRPGNPGMSQEELIVLLERNGFMEVRTDGGQDQAGASAKAAGAQQAEGRAKVQGAAVS